LALQQEVEFVLAADEIGQTRRVDRLEAALTGGVIGIHHSTHVLGIESGREGSGAHQIADHHGDVTALGSGRPGLPALHLPPNCPRDERTGRAGGHRPDRLNEALPVAQRYPELLEIALCQLRQHIAADRVLDECRLITPEAEVSQPAANVHSRALSVQAHHGDKTCPVYSLSRFRGHPKRRAKIALRRPVMVKTRPSYIFANGCSEQLGKIGQ
jgi:hypothetical protein